MNWDGEVGFYRYDTVEGTMQRCVDGESMMSAQYNAETFAALEKETKEKLDASNAALKHSKLLVLILIVVAAVELLLFIAVYAVTRRRRAVVVEDSYDDLYKKPNAGSSHKKGSSTEEDDLLEFWDDLDE